MNFYKHHIGDYAKKTVHLSLLEHGAYLLMLHAYYGTEKPLPIDSLYRIAHAHSKAERAAVDSVASQFWKKTDAGLVNGRAFEELEHASELVAVAKENGKKGGRPKITQWVSENNPAGSEIETQRVLKNKAIQTPDSSIEENTPLPPFENRPRKSKSAKTPIPDDFTITPELADYATNRLPDVDLTELLESFRGKASAKAWQYANWNQGFQEFVRNSAPQSGHWAAGQYPKKQATVRKWD